MNGATTFQFDSKLKLWILELKQQLSKWQGVQVQQNGHSFSCYCLPLPWELQQLSYTVNAYRHRCSLERHVMNYCSCNILFKETLWAICFLSNQSQINKTIWNEEKLFMHVPEYISLSHCYNLMLRKNASQRERTRVYSCSLLQNQTLFALDLTHAPQFRWGKTHHFLSKSHLLYITEHFTSDIMLSTDYISSGLVHWHNSMLKSYYYIYNIKTQY